MKNNKKKNVNLESIDTKHQTIETDTHYIEAPSWLSLDLLDDSDICCDTYDDSIVHKHTDTYNDTYNDTNNQITDVDLNEINLFENNFSNSNLITDDLYTQAETFNINNTNTITSATFTKQEAVINDSQNNKTSIKLSTTVEDNAHVQDCTKVTNNYSYKENSYKENDTHKQSSAFKPTPVKKKFPTGLIALALTVGTFSLLTIAEDIMYYSDSYIDEELYDSYTFENTPDNIYNLSHVAHYSEDSSLVAANFKKALSDTSFVYVEAIDNDNTVNLLSNGTSSQFNIKLNPDTRLIYVEDIIQLSNGDLVINTVVERNDEHTNTVLHYNKNGFLKKQKDFKEYTNVKNLYAQPNSENYFITSQSDDGAVVHKLTGNGNNVFEFKIENNGLDSISIFPIERDLYVFYSYYDNEGELVADGLVLNALGQVTNKKEAFITNASLSTGIATKDGGFLFEESLPTNSSVVENKTIKLSSNLEIEDIKLEDFDFYSNKIIKMDYGFMSVRESLFSPVQDEDEVFSILTFVKLDEYGRTEWVRHCNLYTNDDNPIIGDTFVPEHFYIEDNKIVVEASGIVSDDINTINFTIDALGNIESIYDTNN